MRIFSNDVMEVLINKGLREFRSDGCFDYNEALAAKKSHESLEAYQKTPLVHLDGLAKKIQISNIMVKDESKRFSLNAFKGLGGSYAMFRIICEVLGLDYQTAQLKDLLQDKFKATLQAIEFVTATDGNHGKGVSWAAGIFGCKAHVYMPAGSQEVRAEAIRNAGPADVEITKFNYDDTVRFAKSQSEANGWYLIQDTAWDGYEKIPTWIIQGYLTMILETVEELGTKKIKPTHVFLQAGVGAMAGGVVGFLSDYYKTDKPIIVIVEPQVADCIYRSKLIDDGAMHSIEGSPFTIMAGLNCGTPCKVTWGELSNLPDFYVSCADSVAACGMRTYHKPLSGDAQIISGESGAVTMGVVKTILADERYKSLKESMQLNSDSKILLINTEGDTEPENYEAIISGKLFKENC